MIKVIHAFDPGETTGYCKMSYWFPTQGVIPIDIEIKQFPDMSMVDILLPWPSTPTLVDEEHIVVIENFTPGSINVNFTPLRVIGAIEMVCKQRGIDYRFQMPSDRNWVDKRYRERFEGIRSHGGDAFRHALTYFRFHERASDFKILPEGLRFP